MGASTLSFNTHAYVAYAGYVLTLAIELATSSLAVISLSLFGCVELLHCSSCKQFVPLRICNAQFNFAVMLTMLVCTQKNSHTLSNPICILQVLALSKDAWQLGSWHALSGNWTISTSRGKWTVYYHT